MKISNVYTVVGKKTQAFSKGLFNILEKKNLYTNHNLLKHICLGRDIFHPIWQMFTQPGLGQINKRQQAALHHSPFQLLL